MTGRTVGQGKDTPRIEYKPIAEANNFILLEKYKREWIVADSYQSEDDLEQELIADLQNQGYEYQPDLIS